MEEGFLTPLLPSDEEGGRKRGLESSSSSETEEENRITWKKLAFDETKKLSWLAGPMVAVNLSTFLLQVVSIMMVGHLGKLSLSGSAMAFSFCNVTGFSVTLGMASALETLSGQAYGARQHRKLGIQMFTAMFCLTIICIPLSILWIYLGRILAFIGQDPLISEEAGKFAIWLIPVLYSYAFLQPIFRYLQVQSIIFPMLISSGATLCFHVVLSWVMIYKIGLRSAGAALAMGISIWLNVGILSLYVKYSASCAKTRAPLSVEIFQGIKEFFTFALPSAIMMCLEWWSFEILILLSGLLPNPELETSVLCVCLNTITTLFALPNGLACAVSTRVSNELGAGNPRAAKLSVIVVMFLAVAEGITVAIVIFVSRHVFGYLFSSDKEVVSYVAEMAHLLILSVVLDSIQGTLSGVARGCGWQHIGAGINLAAYYLCGMPIGVGLGFGAKLKGKGLWTGVLSGAIAQVTLLSIVTGCTNWEKQAKKARERALDEKSSANEVLVS